MRRPIMMIVTLGTLALGLSACGNTMEERAATGALAGGAVGAATGGGLTGTAIGAAGGAAAGAVVDELEDRDGDLFD